MWGEIEERPSVREEPEVDATLTGTFDTICASDSYKSCADPDPPGSGDEVECPTSLSSMIEAVEVSGIPVKSQQLGEPDLTRDERRRILLEQYQAKPLVFLERYRAHLKPEHLGAFSHLGSDCRAQHYCKEVQSCAASRAGKTKVRNHRFAALRALQEGGQYFSEEQMRVREPLLYEQYIGQYLNDEEILQRSQETMQAGPGGLADLLLNSYQEKVLQKRMQEEQEYEDAAEEESEEEDGDGKDGSTEKEWEPTAEEKVLLREEFISQMHQRFLEGKDKDFDYSEVDENPDYDNLDIVSRDAEERYFDDDMEEDEDEAEGNESSMNH
ncbi:coiled-coil domain-containing protein 97 [Denticeps clupeoides]|uniref:coiled-coil domain-containing protein 97 n=1 Tax=Denticeps clupeoides TaxID=299321 RepID=UPI0010A40ABD|nr:coiled-coil domain-containing protein 97 [Denticeps clupeoides]